MIFSIPHQFSFLPYWFDVVKFTWRCFHDATIDKTVLKIVDLAIIANDILYSFEPHSSIALIKRFQMSTIPYSVCSFGNCMYFI